MIHGYGDTAEARFFHIDARLPKKDKQIDRLTYTFLILSKHTGEL